MVRTGKTIGYIAQALSVRDKHRAMKVRIRLRVNGSGATEGWTRELSSEFVHASYSEVYELVIYVNCQLVCVSAREKRRIEIDMIGVRNVAIPRPLIWTRVSGIVPAWAA